MNVEEHVFFDRVSGEVLNNKRRSVCEIIGCWSIKNQSDVGEKLFGLSRSKYTPNKLNALPLIRVTLYSNRFD
jgi:hypothetical protein